MSSPKSRVQSTGPREVRSRMLSARTDTMSRLPRRLLRVTALVPCALLASLASPMDAEAPEATSGGPIVVELFTSQGCSSCPPADRLLSQLVDKPAFRGRVLPLAFHVDYWNYIGWQDPFSSKLWSERQHAYAAARRSNRIYTPQLIIQGGEDCVGSQAGCVERAIRKALGAPAAWQLTLTRVEDSAAKIVVEVRAEERTRVIGELDLLIVVTESGFSTPVGRGENARRTLENDHVVRAIRLAPAQAGTHRYELPLAADWQHERLRVVAFLQERKSFRIVAAAGG